MTSGSQLCQSQMFKPPASSRQRPGRLPRPPRRRPRIQSATTSRTAFRRSARTEFNVDRGVVDKILENQAELMRQARIVPEQENGKVVGIRLFGVKPDTLLGDPRDGERRPPREDQRLRHDEPGEGARGLRATAHGRPLTVSVNRRGQETNLDYNIK
jgi:general secretion pathway protein C